MFERRLKKEFDIKLYKKINFDQIYFKFLEVKS